MAENKTVTVYHPAFANVSTEIPAADAEKWAEAGWRKAPRKK